MSATAATILPQDAKPRTTGASSPNEAVGVRAHPNLPQDSSVSRTGGGFSGQDFVNVIDGMPRGGGVQAWYDGSEALALDHQSGSTNQQTTSYDPENHYTTSIPLDYAWSDVGSSSSSVGSPAWLPQMPLQSPGREINYRFSMDEGMELDSVIGDSVSCRGPGSPRPASVYSFHSSVDGRLLREVHGRAFNSSVETYLLPADDEEQNRLTMQHNALVCFLGGLYPWPDRVEEVLRSQSGYTPGILDIGTGSGIWALQMARRYPHADVLGLDLAPPLVPIEEIPDNCRFELDDANLSLSHYANCFDLVHVRAADSGIKDFDAFLYNMAEVLRPGGVLILGSGDPQFYDEKVRPLPLVSEGEPGFRWIQKIFIAVYSAWKATGAIIDWPRTWHKISEGNPNFENVATWQMKMPLGPWPQGLTPEHKRGSILLRNNLINIIGSFTPLFLQDGYPSEMIERWKQETEKELLEMKLHSYANWTWTICQKRNDVTWIQPDGRDDPDTVSESSSWALKS